jgi:MtN3 and saliva related transmembrane protein
MHDAATLVLGIAAATITTSAWVPQAYKTVRTRSARDFSWPSLAMLCAGLALWLAYGVARRDAAITGANVVTLALVATIVVVKLRHRG